MKCVRTELTPCKFRESIIKKLEDTKSFEYKCKYPIYPCSLDIRFTGRTGFLADDGDGSLISVNENLGIGSVEYKIGRVIVVYNSYRLFSLGENTEIIFSYRPRCLCDNCAMLEQLKK
jgi:hypothetical protein